MKVLKQFKTNIPTWAIPYLEYGDASSESFSEEDAVTIEEWREELAKDGYTSPTLDYHWGTESFMTGVAFGLPTECVETTVTQFVP